ncbi:hypothetical protein TUBRATIS_20210 [Tubulinosema ratisbonensis]|uniref:Uncharacterized protein n=1 Tax=Tubulinosema ratisbonensis TaxID=291195 RepID=A0A437AK15_9MICR|nr:hypothetical protein TUBRATIS_20210 [Tubulinosema ratisbonensis]
MVKSTKKMLQGKRNKYFEIKEDVILRTTEFLKILNNELESIKRFKTKQIRFKCSYRQISFSKFKKTFDLYLKWFSITLNHWYSFDIYFIKANIFKKFFNDFLLNEYNFDKEKKKEFKKIFNEIFNNIFNDFNLGFKDIYSQTNLIGMFQFMKNIKKGFCFYVTNMH